MQPHFGCSTQSCVSCAVIMKRVLTRTHTDTHRHAHTCTKHFSACSGNSCRCCVAHTSRCTLVCCTSHTHTDIHTRVSMSAFNYLLYITFKFRFCLLFFFSATFAQIFISLCLRAFLLFCRFLFAALSLLLLLLLLQSEKKKMISSQTQHQQRQQQRRRSERHSHTHTHL